MPCYYICALKYLQMSQVKWVELNISGQCKESNRLGDFYINSCIIWRHILVLINSRRQEMCFRTCSRTRGLDCLSVFPGLNPWNSQRQEVPTVLLWCEQSNSCCYEGFKQKQQRAHYDNGNQSGRGLQWILTLFVIYTWMRMWVVQATSTRHAFKNHFNYY